MIRSLDRRGLLVAAALLLFSLIPVALLVLQVVRFGGVLTGSDGMQAGSDQQLYLQNIRESGSDLLISNEWRIGESDGALLHPMWLVSGLLWKLGLGLVPALWLWKPVAAAALGLAAWAFVGRFLDGRERVAAVVLGLLFFSPALPLVVWADVSLPEVERLVLIFTTGDAMPAFQLWGYFHAALGIGLMTLCLLGVLRALAGDATRALLWASAAGALAAWLHPWKGAILLLVLTGLAAWDRSARRARLLAVPAAAIVVPLAYLALLPRLDGDWEVYAADNEVVHAPWWILLVALGPLVLPALAGLRRLKVADDATRVLVLWPVAAFAVYFAVSQFPYHALQGVAIPLAVLAVLGWRHTRLPAAVAVACIAVVTVPGVVYMVDTFRESRRSGYAPYVLHEDENAALRHLERAPAGGVLSRYYLGMTVPPRTGLDVWVGQFPWTPDFEERRVRAEELFAGRVPAAEARAFVRGTGARYVLADCRSADLAPLLGDLVRRTDRFGCVRVHALR